jgi:hypothetical protein
MPARWTRLSVLALVGATFLAVPDSKAQTGGTGGGPGIGGGGAGGGVPAPALPGGPLGGTFDTSRFQVTSTANQHAAYLWVVDSVQRIVTLCEKGEGAKDFTCAKRPLP